MFRAILKAILRPRVVAPAGAAVIAAATAFIAPWEGLETEAYRDVVGVWTVCYGETANVGPDESYTEAQCKQMLAERVEEFHTALTGCIPQLPKFPTGVQVALTSWSYNVGVGAACRSTLARKANVGDLVGACNELPRWNRAGGAVLRGLTNRRGAERKICLEALE